MVSRQTAAATGLAGRQPHSTACSPTKEITHASRLDRVGRLFGAGKQPTARPAGDRGRTTLSGANLFKRACTPAFLSLFFSLLSSSLPLSTLFSIHSSLFSLPLFLSFSLPRHSFFSPLPTPVSLLSSLHSRACARPQHACQRTAGRENCAISTVETQRRAENRNQLTASPRLLARMGMGLHKAQRQCIQQPLPSSSLLFLLLFYLPLSPLLSLLSAPPLLISSVR